MTVIEKLNFFPERSPFETVMKEPYEEFFKPLSDVIYFPVKKLSEATHRPDDQAIYMIASTFAMVCCLTLKQMKPPKTRRTFSIICGLTINFYVFGCSAAAMLLINLICYLIMLMCPSKKQHIGVFIVAGFGLCSAQFHKIIYDYGMNGLNLPICMMFNYCRITSLACCIKDGTVIAKARHEKGDKTRKIPLTELNVNLKRYELVYAVEELPSFLDFMAYIYFCGASISGPWYEYRDFNDMINF